MIAGTIVPAIAALNEYNLGSPSFHVNPAKPVCPYSVLS